MVIADHLSTTFTFSFHSQFNIDKEDDKANKSVRALSYKPNIGKFSILQRRQKVARVPLCYGRT